MDTSRASVFDTVQITTQAGQVSHSVSPRPCGPQKLCSAPIYVLPAMTSPNMQEQNERINCHGFLISNQLQIPTTLPISERF